MDLLYFDCFSGVSGDMIVGALLDCGADWKLVSAGIESLGLEVQVGVHKQLLSGISCSAFVVEAAPAPLRHLDDIVAVIRQSSLSPSVKTQSICVFNRIAAAEARVHGIAVDKVHFHEIGAIDTIVDVVGAFLCLETMGVKQVFASSLPWNRGFVNISHGRYPLPAPATVLLLKDYPCHPVDIQLELVTPTGAALLTAMAVYHKAMPSFAPSQVGYGAGSIRRADNVPNLLRVVRGSSLETDRTGDWVAVLETEVDDLSPEVFSHLHRILSEHPAVLDFFTTSLFMKKNRPGNLITILADPHAIKDLSHLLIRETGTLGVRHRLQERIKASRCEEFLPTAWGSVRIKIARIGPEEVHLKPEFEDCAAIAQREGISLLKVYEAVSAALYGRGLPCD